MQQFPTHPFSKRLGDCLLEGPHNILADVQPNLGL